jgi:hypothetical protein
MMQPLNCAAHFLYVLLLLLLTLASFVSIYSRRYKLIDSNLFRFTLPNTQVICAAGGRDHFVAWVAASAPTST